MKKNPQEEIARLKRNLKIQRDVYRISSNALWKMERLTRKLEQENQSLKKKLKKIHDFFRDLNKKPPPDIILTVGPGKQFRTLASALNHASQKYGTTENHHITFECYGGEDQETFVTGGKPMITIIGKKDG